MTGGQVMPAVGTSRAGRADAYDERRTTFLGRTKRRLIAHPAGHADADGAHELIIAYWAKIECSAIG